MMISNNNDDENEEDHMNDDETHNDELSYYIYCYKAFNINNTETYFDNYGLDNEIEVGKNYYSTCNFNQESINYISEENMENDTEKITELNEDAYYVTEQGYCAWTKANVQNDMKTYYPNVPYKLAKLKVHLDNLVLLEDNEDTDRNGEIRCDEFEVVDILDTIELTSPCSQIE